MTGCVRSVSAALARATEIRAGAWRSIRGKSARGNRPEETCKSRIGAEAFGCVELAGEFGFGKADVDFLVADVMQKDGRAALAAFQFRDQVVQALRRLGRDRAHAERAGGRFDRRGVRMARKRAGARWTRW